MLPPGQPRTVVDIGAGNGVRWSNSYAWVIQKYKIEKNFGVLCLDIDGNDYWVLDAILQNFRPGLVVTEINENIPPPLRFVLKFDPKFQLRYHFYGYSIAALEDICEKHGFGILELEYNNAFLAPSELGTGRFRDAKTAYRAGYLNWHNRKERFASNLDLEFLHSLSPEEGMRYVENFFTKDAGNYYLTADKESLMEVQTA